MFRYFYVFLLPAIWLVVDAINFRFPGDEFGGWVTGSIPGLWILPFVNSVGHPSRLLPFILAAGGASMTALGLAMDRLRTPVIPWAVLWLVVAVALEAHELARYPSWERAIAKNGSMEAYILPAVNFGLLGSTALMIASMLMIRLLQRSRKPWSDGSKHGEPGGFLDV